MREQVGALRPFLDEVYRRHHTAESLARDPLSFPRRYAEPPDIETAAMIASAFAFGRVAAFMPVVDRILGRLGPHPAGALALGGAETARDAARDVTYRFATPANSAALLAAVGGAMRDGGSFKPLFLDGYRRGGTVEGLLSLAAGVRRHAAACGAGLDDPGFLVPVGSPGSPMKRLCMFLRWMVRDDGIDTGLWNDIPASDLLFPLDVHVFRISTLLGLLPPASPGSKGRAPSMKDSVMLTARLRELDPLDPVRYDFAISHLGISGSCTGTAGARCGSCPLAPVCACPRA